jgi:mitogen-activated protein kinase kinase
MEYCEGGSLDAIYKQIKRRQGRTGEKILGKVAEAVRVFMKIFSSYLV